LGDYYSMPRLMKAQILDLKEETNPSGFTLSI